MEREFERIKNADLTELSKKEPLILNDILRVFEKVKNDTFVAIDHLSVGVKNKECFGLLGR